MPKKKPQPGDLIKNSLGMKFASIPPGSFMMGYAKERPEYLDGPSHKVTMTQGYYLGIHPVTQAVWQKVMGNTPSHFKGDDLPVEQVSWNDCQVFLKKLTEQDGATHRLPTEAEWEHACRAGTTTPYCFGETIRPDQANFGPDRYHGGLTGGTSPVGSFPPNAWKLYDMHGNVWEWCADWHGPYPEGEVIDPQGPQSGQGRVLRGGSWYDVKSNVTSDVRYNATPTYRTYDIGFRVVRTA